MQQSVEQRIEGVINNLLPATALEGKFGSPKKYQKNELHTKIVLLHTSLRL